MSIDESMPKSAWIFPALSVLLFAAVTALHYTFAPSTAGLGFAAVLLVTLFGTVFAAVHHADVIAIRIGEPFGTLLLTLAVTVIEVALIESLMLSEKAVTALARDTVFAVVMIVCNALVGICILAGGLRYREQDVRVSGSNLYLSVLTVLATITLILPNYTLTKPSWLRQRHHYPALWRVSLHADGTASRLFRQPFDGRPRSRAGFESNAVHQHRPLARFASGRCPARQEILSGGGCRRSHDRRAASLCWRRGRNSDPASGEPGCGRRGPEGQSAKEHQPRARLLSRNDWAHRSGGRGGGLRAGQATRARPQRPEYGASAPDADSQPADARRRPHQHPFRDGPPRGICSIYISGVRPLSGRRAENDERDVRCSGRYARGAGHPVAPGPRNRHGPPYSRHGLCYRSRDRGRNDHRCAQWGAFQGPAWGGTVIFPQGWR